MKRILCLLLALAMLCPAILLSSCQKGANQSTDPVSSSDTVSPETSYDGTSQEDLPPDLPAFSTLMGTKHLPIPDNQGALGSCTSEGITYTQFTVAVSQFVNATNPDGDWDPSSGNDDYIFSPKFTYNYAGPSTENAYKVLMDNGCLPFSVSSFYKSPRQPGQPFQNPTVLNHDQTRSWDVAKGLMQQALKYRLTGYEENDFTATQAGQLTTGTSLALFYKVKDALAKGNSVTVCGWPYYCKYTALTKDGAGSIGAEGESVIWSGAASAAGTSSSGNHCVSIIGYDDDITVTVAGVKLTGAFQIMDSYASGPTDIYYIMYDALNLVSEHDVLNTTAFYENTVALSVENMNFQTGLRATGSQMLTFTPLSRTLSFNGKEYPLYTVGHPDKNEYLTFNGQAFGKGPLSSAKSFALIPYADASKEQSKDYEGGYLLALADEQGGVKGYLAAELNTNNATVRFHTTTAEMDKLCFDLSAPIDGASSEPFVVRLSLSKEAGDGFVRTGTMYRFSFIYWDKHIQVGNPQLMVEAQISTVSRENLYISLTRTDKNGNTLEYAPASMDVRYNQNFHPEFVVSGTPLAFSGKENPTKAETGYFTFGYHVLDDFGSAASYDSFIWGINIKGNGVSILKLRLLDQNGKELCVVTPDEKNNAPALKETLRFEFRQQSDLTSHFGKGVYNFYNVGTKKTLSLAGNNMLFEWRKDTNASSVERSEFRVEYVAESDGYILRHGTKNYVFDIADSAPQAGSIVKMNAPSTQRNTQLWTVTLNEDGSMTIANKADPTLFFGYNGKDFCLGNDASDPNFRFIAKVTGESNRNLDLSIKEQTVHATATLPKDCSVSEIKLSVVENGKVKTTLDAKLDGEKLTFSGRLEKGDYLFCLTRDGKAIGNMIAARIS